MAKISYSKGIQCTKCGKILQSRFGVEPNILMPELCQGCGTHLITIDRDNQTYELTNNAKDVVVKRTHKIFNTYLSVAGEVEKT